MLPHEFSNIDKHINEFWRYKMGYFKNLAMDIVDNNLKVVSGITGYDYGELYEFYWDNCDDGCDWDEAMTDVVLTALELDYYDIVPQVEYHTFSKGIELFRAAGGIFTEAMDKYWPLISESLCSAYWD